MPDQAPIDLNSLRGFLHFLEGTAELNLAYPEIVLAPKGQLRAEWGSVSRRFFAVRFVGRDEAHFVVMAPDPANSDKTARGSATCALDSVMALADPYGVKNWLAERSER